MALHSGEDGDNMSVRNRGVFLVVDPPFMEGSVRMYEEALSRGWRFGKCVRDVGTEHEEILGSRYCIKETRTGLIDTICICFIQDTNHTRARGSVTHTSCLFPAINGLDRVGPNKVENRIVFCRGNRIAKHALGIVLIQLEVL